MRRIHLGCPWPLGSSITPRGVNFSVAAPAADRLELLLFSDGSARSPEQVIDMADRPWVQTGASKIRQDLGLQT